VSEHTDEPQNWPLRDWSTRLRPPGGPQPLDMDELGHAEILYEEGEPERAEPSTGPGTAEPEPAPSDDRTAAVEDSSPAEESAEPSPEPEVPEEHAEGALDIPGGYAVLEGSPNGQRRSVAVVVSRFNGEITNRLLESALAALGDAGVEKDAIMVMPVPGAFELPIAAMALAKTRRYACVVALGCVIRGETPHFDFVATEAASGLQLAGIETGVPVAFGVLTCDTAEQAEARVDRGAWAARSALEMADAFAQLRTAAAAR
jgi:6,7-dimethyl-8-ribityllumazine synthase